MEWHPASFFRTDIIPENPYAILVLNQPINENAFDAVRRHGMPFYFISLPRIFADGNCPWEEIWSQ